MKSKILMSFGSSQIKQKPVASPDKISTQPASIWALRPAGCWVVYNGQTNQNDSSYQTIKQVTKSKFTWQKERSVWLSRLSCDWLLTCSSITSGFDKTKAGLASFSVQSSSSIPVYSRIRTHSLISSSPFLPLALDEFRRIVYLA